MILVGDCLEQLQKLEPESIDAMITDPPAGIGFMNKDWDRNRGGRDKWIAWLKLRLGSAHRVLKPGAHILVWALPRTSHWTGIAIEDAGYEVRDRVSHFFGSGFPKSADIAKAIDKSLGVERTVVGANPNHRPVSGTGYSGVYQGGNTGNAVITAATSPEAQKCAGLATALKPACEDWWLARKPFTGPTYKNVLEHGTGALNIDGCRISTEEKLTRRLGKSTESETGWKSTNRSEIAGKDGGRWPANITFDELAAAVLDEQSSGKSRFFYCAKPSRREKSAGVDGKNGHPTVKSVDLMTWLVTLITPLGGTVLDPFAGSGSTGVACLDAGFEFLGIEENAEYAEIAKQRLEHARLTKLLL